MKLTLQVPESVGRELLRLPDRDTFVSRTVAKALEERRQRARSEGRGSARIGRRLDPSEERTLRLPRIKNRKREIAWRRSHQQELQSRFEGQWVVLEGEEVVAASQDAARAVEEARAKGIAIPYVFFVDRPRPGVVQLGL
ncbi:MAG: hypothetical protein GY719_11060 [bacterium]|nr:hypothetical protein [bacterium]